MWWRFNIYICYSIYAIHIKLLNMTQICCTGWLENVMEKIIPFNAHCIAMPIVAARVVTVKYHVLFCLQAFCVVRFSKNVLKSGTWVIRI